MNGKNHIAVNKKTQTGKFVYFERVMLYSPAFSQLSPGAVVLLLNFHKKKEISGGGDYRIMNNGNIEMKYSETGFSKATSAKYLDELINAGFIALNRKGTANLPSTYFISEEWRVFGTEKFHISRRRKGPPESNLFT